MQCKTSSSFFVLSCRSRVVQNCLHSIPHYFFYISLHIRTEQILRRSNGNFTTLVNCIKKQASLIKNIRARHPNYHNLFVAVDFTAFGSRSKWAREARREASLLLKHLNELFFKSLLSFSWFNFSISYFYSLLVHVDYVNYHVVIFMAHLHLNELSLICDMWLNKITYLLTYLRNNADVRRRLYFEFG